MVMSPLKNSALEDFRRETGSQSAPPFFDSEQPITPVVIIGGNIGFTKPRSDQKLKTYTFSAATGGATVDTQIATTSSTTRIYILSVVMNVASGAVASGQYVFDGTSGTVPAFPNDSVKYAWYNPAGQGINQYNFTLPVPVYQGIRVTNGNTTGGSVLVTITWIEETI